MGSGSILMDRTVHLHGFLAWLALGMGALLLLILMFAKDRK
jgi:hypothetical protein